MRITVHQRVSVPPGVTSRNMHPAIGRSEGRNFRRILVWAQFDVLLPTVISSNPTMLEAV